MGEKKGIGGNKELTILWAVLLFGFIIFIHELGHFLAAKRFNVKVLKFSIGFGPKVIGKKIGETEYLLSAVPLGGYVKMLGEDPEDKDAPAEPLTPEDEARSFKNQSIRMRAAIVFAGPLFNLLTAVLIFFAIYIHGVPALLPVIGEVMADSPAMRAGLKQGDEILSINGKVINQWAEMTEIIHKSPNRPLQFAIKRAGHTLNLTITPEPKIVKDLFGEDKEVGMIGIKPSDKVTVVQYGLIEASDKALLKTGEIIYLTFVGIVKLFQKIIPADNIGGPILIFQLAEKTASLGVISFLTFTAVISINLGILNLLPIPVLDGGHLLFFAIEAIRKRPLDDRIIVVSQKVGMALIIMLMAFAMYNDIFRIISGSPIP